MIRTAIAWLLVLLLLPLIVVWNLTESRSTKIRRARDNGHSWKQIAARYGVSPSTVKRWSEQRR